MPMYLRIGQSVDKIGATLKSLDNRTVIRSELFETGPQCGDPDLR